MGWLTNFLLVLVIILAAKKQRVNTETSDETQGAYLFQNDAHRIQKRFMQDVNFEGHLAFLKEKAEKAKKEAEEAALKLAQGYLLPFMSRFLRFCPHPATGCYNEGRDMVYVFPKSFYNDFPCVINPLDKLCPQYIGFTRSNETLFLSSQIGTMMEPECLVENEPWDLFKRVSEHYKTQTSYDMVVRQIYGKEIAYKSKLNETHYANLAHQQFGKIVNETFDMLQDFNREMISIMESTPGKWTTAAPLSMPDFDGSIRHTIYKSYVDCLRELRECKRSGVIYYCFY